LLSKNINIKVYRTIILPAESCALLGYYAASSGNKPEDRNSHLLRSGTLKSRIILPVVVYGCERWFLTFSEGHKLRARENSVLGKCLGLNRYEVTGDWRRSHNEELQDLHFSPNVTPVIKLRGEWSM
jgi:hypothetical protein